jgi:hypothetical protein
MPRPRPGGAQDDRPGAGPARAQAGPDVDAGRGLVDDEVLAAAARFEVEHPVPHDVLQFLPVQCERPHRLRGEGPGELDARRAQVRLVRGADAAVAVEQDPQQGRPGAHRGRDEHRGLHAPRRGRGGAGVLRRGPRGGDRGRVTARRADGLRHQPPPTPRPVPIADSRGSGTVPPLSRRAGLVPGAAGEPEGYGGLRRATARGRATPCSAGEQALRRSLDSSWSAPLFFVGSTPLFLRGRYSAGSASPWEVLRRVSAGTRGRGGRPCSRRGCGGRR